MEGSGSGTLPVNTAAESALRDEGAYNGDGWGSTGQSTVVVTLVGFLVSRPPTPEKNMLGYLAKEALGMRWVGGSGSGPRPKKVGGGRGRDGDFFLSTEWSKF